MLHQTVSIAMATYNGQRFLGDQLASLGSQSLKPLELIVTDDRSSDATLGMLRSFAKRAPFPVRVVRNEENLGYRLNFIKAASLCSGSVIAFCDQDDVWEQHKVAAVTRHFSGSDDWAVSHDFSVFFDDCRPPIASYFDFLRLSGLPPACSIKGCTTAFRRELIAKFGWPDRSAKINHDTWVCLTSALLRKRGYIHDSLINYRIHGRNASGVILGGDRPVGRIMRSLSLPPFTSKDELDLTLGFLIPNFIPDDNHALVRNLVVSSSGDAPVKDRQSALDALERNLAIRRFVTGELYARPIRRTFRAFRLFLQRAYRNGDGVQGLLLDVLGRRV